MRFFFHSNSIRYLSRSVELYPALAEGRLRWRLWGGNWNWCTASRLSTSRTSLLGGGGIQSPCCAIKLKVRIYWHGIEFVWLLHVASRGQFRNEESNSHERRNWEAHVKLIRYGNENAFPRIQSLNPSYPLIIGWRKKTECEGDRLHWSPLSTYWACYVQIDSIPLTPRLFGFARLHGE